MPSEDWKDFLIRSQKKKALSGSLRKKVLEEFLEWWRLMRNNESLEYLAAMICVKHSDYNVAGVLHKKYVSRLP